MYLTIKDTKVQPGTLLQLVKPVDKGIAVNEQLARSLGYIQVVLKELVDRGQRLLVEFIWALVLENFPDEHSAKRNRQLVYKSSDTQLVIRNDLLVIKENLADIQRHLGFLVGMTEFLEQRPVRPRQTCRSLRFSAERERP